MKTPCFILTLLTLAATAAAQIPLAAPPLGSADARIAGIGDVDGDGLGDVVVWRPQTAAVAVYSGVDGSSVASWSLPSARPDGAVTSGGDADGNGLPDLLMSDGTAALNTPIATVEIRDAGNGALLATIPSFQPACGFGYRAARVGDLDGDDEDDFAVAAPTASTSGLSLNGSVRLHSSDGSFIASIDGWLAGQGAGAGVAGVGDVDGDAVPDVAIASLDGGGTVRVHSGADLSVISSFSLGGTPLSIATLLADGLDLDGGLDVDGDGRGDFVVSKPSHGAGGPNSGAAFVVSAVDGAVVHGFLGAPGDGLGTSCDLDDMNGDGRGDVVLGAGASGEVIVASGLTGATVWSSHELSSNVIDSKTVGDADGDGLADLVLRSGPGAGIAELVLIVGGPWLGAAADTSVGTASNPEELLTVSGLTGGASRRQDVAPGAPFTIELGQPSLNGAPADFVIFGKIGVPGETEGYGLGALGQMAIVPSVIAPAATDLFTLATSVPIPGAIFPGTATPYTLGISGIPVEVSFTLQAVVAQTPVDAKATNAVIVRVK